jgi:Tfp pilus assembly protein PilO
MTKITKKQKSQLTAVGGVAVVVIAGLWYFVVRAQNAELATANAKCAMMKGKLDNEHTMVYSAEKIGEELASVREKLKLREAAFAPEHEPYSWMREVMNRFYQAPNGALPYKTVSKIDFKQPEITDKGIIADFPYKWATFHITGEGHYHDFGKFVADFENAFPYFSIRNIDITVPTIKTDPEMLAYSFDIVTPQVSGTEKK